MNRLIATVAIAAGAIAAAALWPAAGLAQRGLPPRGSLPPSPPSQQVPQFRSRVDLVHLDVSVLDQNRRPVKGLGPADFTVLENGVEQSIAAFSAVDMPDPEPPKAAWMREVAPDVRTNEDLKERRLFLIIIDDAATELWPVVIKNIRESALRVVDRLHPADLAAVVFTRDNKNSQDFTADRARLRAAIETYKGGSREGMPELYFRMSVEVVMRAVQSLVDLPDRRKAVVYLGEGVPVDLDDGRTGGHGARVRGRVQRDFPARRDGAAHSHDVADVRIGGPSQHQRVHHRCLRLSRCGAARKMPARHGG